MSDVIEALPFDIFKEEFPALSENGNYAKKYIDDDPDACLNKIRMIGEYIVYEIYMRVKLEYDPYNKKITQKVRIKKLRYYNYIDKLQADYLDRIQDSGSIGSHIRTVFKSKTVLDEERRELLRICYDLSLWFAINYGEKKYSLRQKPIASVVAVSLPSNEKKQSTNEKHNFSIFKKMQEWFFQREKQEIISTVFSPEKVNNDEIKDNSYQALALYSLKTLNKSILETISNEKVSFENFIDRSFFDKESFLKMFIDIPEIGIRVFQIEVSQGFFKYVMGNNPSSFKGANLPVENVSWYDAVAFCNKLSVIMNIDSAYDISDTSVSWKQDSLGFRLPTVNEWQFSAKGGETYKYSGSNNIEDVCWYKENSNNMTHDSSEKRANGYNLCDMCGNVWEWCWDSTAHKDIHYLCGGSWKSNADYCQIGFVRKWRAGLKKDNIGFRIVQSIK